MEAQTNSYYKYCIVPMCKNNIKTAPAKIYFHMPKDANIRKKWCKAMRRDNVSCLSSLYCCEDHFDIEKDTQNYIKYKIMALEHGQRISLLLKKGVLPHIFQCQKKDQYPPRKRKVALTRRQAQVEEALAEANETKTGPSTASISLDDPVEESLSTASISLDDPEEEGPSTASISDHDLLEAGPSTASLPLDKSIQVKVQYRSKGVSVNSRAKKSNISSSPFSIPHKDMSTSPFKSAQSSVKRKFFSDRPAHIDSVSSVNSHGRTNKQRITLYALSLSHLATCEYDR